MTKPKSTPPKKPGRAPGSPRVAGSGRKPGVPNKITTNVKEMILAKGKPIELLCAVSRGLRVRVGAQAGPGEPEWCYPDLSTRIQAARTLLGKVIPDMKATELSGPEGKPLVPPMYNMPDKELARRCALILTLNDEAVTEGSAEARPSSGRSGGEGAQVSSGSPAASSPSARGNGAADADDKGGRGPDSPGGAMASTEDPHFSVSDNFSEISQPKKPAPVPPAEGEDAHFGQYIVKCREPMRPGLPLTYRVHASNGALLAGACAGWAGALAWIKRRSGDDADLTWMVRLPLRGDGTSPDIRPDQRESPPPRPTVKNDYGWRKSSR